MACVLSTSSLILTHDLELIAPSLCRSEVLPLPSKETLGYKYPHLLQLTRSDVSTSPTLQHIEHIGFEFGLIGLGDSSRRNTFKKTSCDVVAVYGQQHPNQNRTASAGIVPPSGWPSALQPLTPPNSFKPSFSGSFASFSVLSSPGIGGPALLPQGHD
ncbi:hypothetical protein BDP27DRAFT_45272 [Rhodocollybia butyracea]|uniref:Uncharacterized protein n=1 Tax=Rhodocollybia butyracea TaxID=206335 RepID=A0A9P5U4G6_9AGAR|nr:hypothetical protein BDP27DRAFT_45272 [Rhodocollybia butyracea]